MKEKTIKKIMFGKISEWIDTIEDEKLKEKVTKDVIVTGGSITSMLLNEPVNDFDVYFKTFDTTLAVSKYYVEKFNTANPDKNIKPVIRLSNNEVLKEKLRRKYFDLNDEEITKEDLRPVDGDVSKRIHIFIQSAGVTSEKVNDNNYKYFELDLNQDDGLNYVENADGLFNVTNEESDEELELYRPVFLSENAITLSHKVQLVTRFYGSPEEIHTNYDYVHAMNYYDYNNNKLVLKAEALQAILEKDLKYVGSKYPLASLFRMRKFINRGWQCNAGQIVKMALQLNAMDLTDLETLREQLTGVDQAYFYEIIQIAEKRIESGKQLDSTYLISIVNKMFS